jgi:hypothetical protein
VPIKAFSFFNKNNFFLKFSAELNGFDMMDHDVIETGSAEIITTYCA